MGIMNLLKGNWSGRVGQTVGSKWKDKSTIRSYAKPSNPNTPDQQTTRTGFAAVSAFVALFADMIKRFSSLDIRSMSVRNAILSLNSTQVATGALVPSTLKVNKGGLPNASGFSASVAAGLASLTALWTPPTASTISADAVMVVVAVDKADSRAYVKTALASTGTVVITESFAANANLDVYHYIIDYRGSSKVGSPSAYTAVTAPAA